MVPDAFFPRRELSALETCFGWGEGPLGHFIGRGEESESANRYRIEAL